jgi:3-methylcrotonyl-CoA carboxylase alpha subunit
MIAKLLVANRGEIACRVIRTARRLGIATVAVYSDADRDALHVQQADEAVHIGPAPAAESYLRQDKILEAARRTGAAAIHPGYGFLSENAGFASACEDCGLIFIGPPPAAIEAMGSKSRAKQIMGEAGVPLIPGYHGEAQDAATLRREADAMGYPVLLKATAGGGGKGMRAVAEAGAFDEALAAAQREARASFGDDRMLVEKLLQRPRHVEVQVFCDSHGNAVYLAERDCSLQRRHQKVIEEAPAPGLSPELRQSMGETAVAAARAIGYLGAGTVEFLLDSDGAFYFMEMNTRLQVEHPVTEMVTGQDLVEWQLRVADGEPLPLAQEDVTVEGHALEARIYAEDVERDFMPSTGVISYLSMPEAEHGLRIDTGIAPGSEISPYYDPMIAKLIAHGQTRDEALQRLKRGLREFRIKGPRTNIEFLYNLASAEPFASMDLDTGFIGRHADLIFHRRPAQLDRDLAAAALLVMGLRSIAMDAAGGDDRWSPWADGSGWRVNVPHRQVLRLHCHGDVHEVALQKLDGGYRMLLADKRCDFTGSLTGDRLTLELAGHRVSACVAAGDGTAGDSHTLFWDDGACEFHEVPADIGEASAAAGDSSFAAPMHGTVVAHLAEPGSAVKAGDGVVVIEAMKMEQTLRAPCNGRVVAYPCAVGDLVDRGQALVEFEAEP